MARRRRKHKKSRRKSNSLSLPLIGRVPLNPLIGAAVAVIGEPFLDQGWNMVTSALPIPANIGPVQADDAAKFLFAPKVGGMIGGDIGRTAGSTVRILAAVRMMDTLIGGVTSGGTVSSSDGDDF